MTPDRQPPPQLIDLAQEQFKPLSAAEITLLQAAQQGEIAYCGPQKLDDPANDPAGSDNWGPERRIRARLIKWLCVDQDARGCVDSRGIRVQSARIEGKFEIPFLVVPFPLGFVRCSFWENLELPSIEISSLDLTGTWMNYLNLDHATVKGSVILTSVRSTGLQLCGARIGGNLECQKASFLNPALPDTDWSGVAIDATDAKVDGAVLLRNGFTAEGAVRLFSITVGESLDCSDATFRNPAQKDPPSDGVAIDASNAMVTGNIMLSGGFIAEGIVRVYGAHIGGSLFCENGTFRNPAQKDIAGAGTAIEATNVNVSGPVYLRKGFVAEGAVWLIAAQIGGDLDCRTGSFRNPPSLDVPASGVALSTEEAKVAGTVHLCDGFVAEGAVWMLGTRIDWSLDCDGGTFNNLPLAEIADSAPALNMEGITVGGSAYLRAGFTANGLVRMFASRIGGNLECDGGKFHNPAKPGIRGSGTAFDMEGAKIEGAVYLRNKFNAEGHVRMYSAQVAGNLEFEQATFESLNLEEASARAILDDKLSWPKPGMLFLDGFEYDRIAVGPISAKERLVWLARQASFTRHPYRRLAHVLKESGDNRGWRLVSARMERRTWEKKPWPWVSRPTSWLLRNTIAYGYFPGRALWWLLALVIAGSALYQLGYKTKSMVPIDKDAYAAFVGHQQLPGNCPAFHAIPYSLENSFPLVKLGIEDSWTPASGEQDVAKTGNSWLVSHIASPHFIQVFRWIQICLGWLLGTLFVGGVTGVIRND